MTIPTPAEIAARREAAELVLALLYSAERGLRDLGLADTADSVALLANDFDPELVAEELRAQT